MARTTKAPTTETVDAPLAVATQLMLVPFVELPKLELTHAPETPAQKMLVAFPVQLAVPMFPVYKFKDKTPAAFPVNLALAVFPGMIKDPAKQASTAKVPVPESPTDPLHKIGTLWTSAWNE